MDSLTHLVAGALTPLLFRSMPKRAAVLGFGIAAGELPDIDILFGFSPEALLTLHRGITHALPVQPLLALLVLMPFYFWIRRRPVPACTPTMQGGTLPPSPRATTALNTGNCSFGVMYYAALLALCLHVYLDSMTTFGTRIFLPFSEMRVALPALFIVDPLLTLPLLALLVYAWRQRPHFTENGNKKCSSSQVSKQARCAARIALVWLLVYPLACLGINVTAANHLAPGLGEAGRLRLLPEPFSPFIWKAVADKGAYYRVGTVSLLSTKKPGMTEVYFKPDKRLYANLKQQVPLFGLFESFASLMVQEKRPVPLQTETSNSSPLTEYSFVDLRYIVTANSPLRLTGRTDPYFTLVARVDSAGTLVAYRFLRRGADLDTPWVLGQASEARKKQESPNPNPDFSIISSQKAWRTAPAQNAPCFCSACVKNKTTRIPQ